MEGFDWGQLARSARAARRELRRRALQRITDKLEGREGRVSHNVESVPPDPEIPIDVWWEVREKEAKRSS